MASIDASISLCSFYITSMFTTVRSSLITLAVLASGCFALAEAHSRFVYYVESATEQQCLTEDWPANQHEAHVAFCDMYVTK